MNKNHLLLLLLLILGCNEKKVEQNEMGKVVYYLNSDGKIDGMLTQFHQNGNIYWEANFIEGLKQGEVEYYDSLGNLTLRANYIDSKLVGTNTEYYLNGSVKWYTEYSDGKKVGDHVMYDENKNILVERTYISDSLINEFEYDSIGNINGHYINVQDIITKAEQTTTFTFNCLNPYFEEFGIEILSIDSNDEMDTLFQEIIDQAKYSIELKNADLNEKRIQVQYLEVDSLGVVKGIKRFLYEF